MKKLALLLTDLTIITCAHLCYLQFRNAAAIAEGHDYVTSKRDERFTLPDPILTRSWSLLQNRT